MTKRKWFQDSPLLKFSALNAVLRGWINYYRHCNVKEIAKDLDFWVNQRLFRWLCKRHKLFPKHIIKMYKLREDGRRFNLGIRNGDKILYLYRLSDLPLTKYRSRSPENPYIQGEYRTGVPLADQLRYRIKGKRRNTIQVEALPSQKSVKVIKTKVKKMMKDSRFTLEERINKCGSVREHVNFARTNELIGSDRNESKSSQKLILTQQ